MGVVGFVVYCSVVIGVCVAGYKVANFVFEKITGDKFDWDYFLPDGILASFVVLGCLVLGIWLNCQAGKVVANISEFECQTTVYEVKGVKLMDQQTSKSSSAAYLVWTDENGSLHENRASNVKLVDSNEWKFEVIEYETIGWLKGQFYRKDKDLIMYVPFEEVYGTKN